MTDERAISRRDFLRVTGTAAFAAAVTSYWQGMGPASILFAQENGAGDVAFVGFRNGATAEEIGRRLEEAIRAVDDLSWLRPGQTVAVKVASNSGFGYPMTTHPELLKAMIRLLRERGARVIVADQAGMEWVAPASGERVAAAVRDIWARLHSGTRTGMEVLEMNGLARAAREAGAEVRSLDRDEDFVRVGATPHWPEGFRIARIYQEADHVVNLARPAGHVMAGHTATVKNWYGWLHPMDRVKSHVAVGLGRSGDARDRRFGVQNLNERIAEVASAFVAKTRLHVVGAIDAYADIGPDWGTQPLGQSAILASKDMLAVDAATAALLAHEKHRVPRDQRAANWRDPVPWWKFWEADKNESFWGGVEGRFHAFHGTRVIDDLASHPRTGGVWDIAQIRHGREIGLGSGHVTLRTHGEVDPGYVEAVRDLAGGTVREAELHGITERLEQETNPQAPQGGR